MNSFQLVDVTGSENERGSIFVELIGEILSDTGRGSSDPNEFAIVVGFGSLPADVGHQGVHSQYDNNRREDTDH